MMEDPSGLIVGDAETVGIRYFPGEKEICPPLRVIYPATFNVVVEEDTALGISKTTTATSAQSQQRVSWFQEHGVGFFWNGYLHVIGIKNGSLLYGVFSAFIGMIASLATFACSTLGMRGLHFPSGLLSIDAPPAIIGTKEKKPLIVFSHGLTGTGEENLLLMSAWAKMGFVVMAVHHTDGSSCRVRIQSTDQDQATLSSFSDVFYKHSPPYANYDASFRPKQTLHRMKDIQQALDFVATSPDLATIRSICNVDEVISTGYSYGAATAVLVAHTIPQRIKGLILLDGWFYIDVPGSPVEFEHPHQAFPPKDNNDSTPTTTTVPIPSVFINSEVFEGYTKIYQATRQLASKFRAPDQMQFDHMHVIKGTKHNNFCEVIFWMPTRLLQYAGVIGQCDPIAVYREMIQISTDFLKANFPQKE